MRSDISRKQLSSLPERRLEPLTNKCRSEGGAVGVRRAEGLTQHCGSIIVVGLAWEASQEAVPAILGIAPCHNVPHDAAEESAPVEEEGHDEKPSVVVVSADGPSRDASHADSSTPHVIRRDHVLANGPC